MVSAAFPAEAGTPANGDGIEQLAGHFIRKGRKGNWLASTLIAAAVGTGGFFGMKAAGERRDEKIGAVEIDAAVHDTKAAHDGAATKVEVKALEIKVQSLDKSVGELGVKIDGQEKRQTERHNDLKGDLRDLRRRRRDP